MLLTLVDRRVYWRVKIDFIIMYDESCSIYAVSCQLIFLSADSFSSALLVRLEDGGGGGDFFSKVWEGKEEFVNRPVQEIHPKGSWSS